MPAPKTVIYQKSRDENTWKPGERVGGLQHNVNSGEFQGTYTKDGLMVVTLSQQAYGKWGVSPDLGGHEMAAAVMRKVPGKKELAVVGILVGDMVQKVPGNPNSERHFQPAAFQHADGRVVKAEQLAQDDPMRAALDTKYYINTKTWNIAAPGDLPAAEQKTLKAKGTSTNKTTDDMGATVLRIEQLDIDRTRQLGEAAKAAAGTATTPSKPGEAPAPKATGKGNGR